MTQSTERKKGSMNPLREWIEEQRDKPPDGTPEFVFDASSPFRTGWRWAMNHVLKELKAHEETEGESIKHYYSKQGLPLSYWHETNEGIQGSLPRPVLCVGLYDKWYELFLVHPDGRVEEVWFSEMEKDAAELHIVACPNHCPNPMVVQKFAERKGYILNNEAKEMIDGRWFLDCKELCSDELELIIKKAYGRGIPQEVFEEMRDEAFDGEKTGVVDGIAR